MMAMEENFKRMTDTILSRNILLNSNRNLLLGVLIELGGNDHWSSYGQVVFCVSSYSRSLMKIVGISLTVSGLIGSLDEMAERLDGVEGQVTDLMSRMSEEEAAQIAAAAAAAAGGASSKTPATTTTTPNS